MRLSHFDHRGSLQQWIIYSLRIGMYCLHYNICIICAEIYRIKRSGFRYFVSPNMNIVYITSIKETLLAQYLLQLKPWDPCNSTKIVVIVNASLLVTRFSVNTNRLLIETINFAKLRYCVTSMHPMLFPVLPIKFSLLYIVYVIMVDMIRIFRSYDKLTSKLSPSVHFSNYLPITLQAMK